MIGRAADLRGACGAQHKTRAPLKRCIGEAQIDHVDVLMRLTRLQGQMEAAAADGQDNPVGLPAQLRSKC